jgi:ABC-type phosphate transport system substrate-binding protein
MKTLTSRLFACALLGLAALPATAAPVLIGHKSVAAEKIDSATVKAVFLGKKVAWDSAGRVVIAVLKAGPVADEFLQGSVAMTGGGTAPKAFESADDLRKFVSETPGAIGFLDAGATDASVATLTPTT